MASAVTARKQTSRQEDWVAALATIEERVPYAAYAALRDRTIATIKAGAHGRMAYGWSGGKDAQATRLVAEAAGITECVMVITDLEYPAFLKWATSHMPDGLTVEFLADLNRDWLLAHQDRYLFPQGQAGSTWFTFNQVRGLARYYRRERLDGLIVGRRRLDGNFVGRTGSTIQTTDGITKWSPLADWTHDDVLACLHYEGLGLAPCYRWPRGFQVGTGPWPARQYTRSEAHGWEEVHAIDPGIVTAMAPHFPGAAACLERH